MDRFKVINDSLGHIFGDKLLKRVAERLGRIVRPPATLARLGGDEFIALLAGIDSEEQALAVADRILAELARPYDLELHEVYVTASVGVVLADASYERPEHALRDADTALYRAKARGKAQHAVFDKAMH